MMKMLLFLCSCVLFVMMTACGSTSTNMVADRLCFSFDEECGVDSTASPALAACSRAIEFEEQVASRCAATDGRPCFSFEEEAARTQTDDVCTLEVPDDERDDHAALMERLSSRRSD